MPEFERFVTVSAFLRLLALVYFIAFCSFGVQAMGLIGSHGILPARRIAAAVARVAASLVASPTVFWW